MNLKPQDVVLLLKLLPERQSPRSYNALAVELAMSPSEVYGAAKRALAAHLGVRHERRVIPQMRNLEEFLVHGIKYVFVPERGGLTRGMPTAVAAPPLANVFGSSNEPPPVWPDAEGEVRGESFSPLYRSVPSAARRDARLYELLALVDAIRGGRARERKIAVNKLHERLNSYA